MALRLDNRDRDGRRHRVNRGVPRAGPAVDRRRMDGCQRRARLDVETRAARRRQGRTGWPGRRRGRRDTRRAAGVGQRARGAEIVRLPVRVTQGVQLDARLVTVGGDHLAVADVESDVRETLPHRVLEEDQIARLQVGLIHVRRGSVGLAQILGNVDAVLGEDEMREADAREPGGGLVAHGGIRRSDVALRGGDDLSHGRRGGATGSGARAGRICGSLPWMATAGATSGESAGGDTGQQASWGLNLHHPRLAGWLYHVFDAHSLRQYE